MFAVLRAVFWTSVPNDITITANVYQKIARNEMTLGVVSVTAGTELTMKAAPDVNQYFSRPLNGSVVIFVIMDSVCFTSRSDCWPRIYRPRCHVSSAQWLCASPTLTIFPFLNGVTCCTMINVCWLITSMTTSICLTDTTGVVDIIMKILRQWVIITSIKLVFDNWNAMTVNGIIGIR